MISHIDVWFAMATSTKSTAKDARGACREAFGLASARSDRAKRKGRLAVAIDELVTTAVTISPLVSMGLSTHSIIFAQDGNFNRGGYRLLEDQWAQAKRAGKSVIVKIVPVYEGASQRPSAINIWFWIDGKGESLNFSNEFQEKHNAK